jgi:hypothetical protein
MSDKEKKEQGEEAAKREGPKCSPEMCREVMSREMPDCCGPEMRKMMSRFRARVEETKGKAKE